MNKGDIVMPKSLYDKGDMSMPAVITEVKPSSVKVEYFMGGRLREGYGRVESLVIIEEFRNA